MKVTAVFDIGKTNKKFFLFDKDYKEVYRDYQTFPEIKDDDGYPADDLNAITLWLQSKFEEIITAREFNIKSINFSTYGASFIHIDKDGKPLTPIYNYTRKLPENVKGLFFDKYGPPEIFEQKTGSQFDDFLNSGLQLFWLKETKPEIFHKIRYSLHFPQYLSYLFTGIPMSGFPSVGCHTGLWDFEKEDYHDWVYREGIHSKLPPLIPSDTSINRIIKGRKFKIGVGIHDSSSSMLPYILSDNNPFVLLSTGTWCVALNPFTKDTITNQDIENACLNYMRYDGRPVRASKLFLGNEYKKQVNALNSIFNKKYGFHRDIKFNEKIYLRCKQKFDKRFNFESFGENRHNSQFLQGFESFEEGFHQLMIELMDYQVQSLKSAIGKANIQKLYIDGGFAGNDIFVKLLSHHFPKLKLRTTMSPLGSALGAAMIISNPEIPEKFLKKHYKLEKHEPLILMN